MFTKPEKWRRDLVRRIQVLLPPIEGKPIEQTPLRRSHIMSRPTLAWLPTVRDHSLQTYLRPTNLPLIFHTPMRRLSYPSSGCLRNTSVPGMVVMEGTMHTMLVPYRCMHMRSWGKRKGFFVAFQDVANSRGPISPLFVNFNKLTRLARCLPSLLLPFSMILPTISILIPDNNTA